MVSAVYHKYSMTTEPQSQDDWTIQSINIHGAFFEAWCRDVVSRVPGWALTYYKYPVEWPRFHGYLRGQETSLDLRADCWSGHNRVSLLIECKNRNPELTEWVFFPKRHV